MTTIKRRDITDVLPVGMLEDGEFTPDAGGLAVRMSGFYTVGEIKAILEDLIYCDAKYQALQLLKQKYWFKGQNMKNTFLDILTAIAIGLMLCIGLLSYFDVLTK